MNISAKERGQNSGKTGVFWVLRVDFNYETGELRPRKKQKIPRRMEEGFYQGIYLGLCVNIQIQNMSTTVGRCWLTEMSAHTTVGSHNKRLTGGSTLRRIGSQLFRYTIGRERGEC